MNSPSQDRNRRSSFGQTASKETLSTRIQSFASNSGVGHLVGIAEQNERKPMKEEIKELKEEINRLGLSHLIEKNSGLGMQSELKILRGIISEHGTNKNLESPIESTQAPQLVNETPSLQVPRRQSFARELVSQAKFMGIETSDTPQPLTRPSSNRRLSTVIKSVASNSGVGHLVGIAEQSNRKPMKVQLEELKQEIAELGLSHLVNENNKTMSLSSEIKALKKILSDHQQQLNPFESDQTHSLEPRDEIRLVPRRDSFAKQLLQKAETIGIQTSDNSQAQRRPSSNRRLSTVIKSVASNSGVGHLVGIAEQSNRKPMKVQLEELKQEIAELGLSHLVNENNKTMSLSSEIKALKKILSDHRETNEKEEFSLSSESSSSAPLTNHTRQYRPFPSLDDHSLQHIEETDEALMHAQDEIDKLKTTVMELNGLIEMQRDEILRLQGINDENVELMSLQSQLFKEQSSSEVINELMRMKIVLELKDKFCEDLQKQLGELFDQHNEIKGKYDIVLTKLEEIKVSDANKVVEPGNQDNSHVSQSLFEECQESLRICQLNLQQKEKELEIQQSENSRLLNQNQQISLNAEVLINEMQKCLEEKNLAENTINQLKDQLVKSKETIEIHETESEGRVKQYLDEISLGNSHVQKLQDELLASRNAFQSLQEQYESVLRENNSISKNLAEVMSSQTIADSDFFTLRRTYDTLLEEKNIQSQEISKLENTLESYRSQLISSESALRDKEEALKAMSEELQDLLSKNQFFSVELINKEISISTISQQNKSLQEQLNDSENHHHKTIELLQEKINGLKSSISDLASQNENLSSTINEYEKKETKYIKDIHDLNELLSEQNQFLRDAADSLDVAEEEIGEFETELLTSQAEIKRLKSYVTEVEEEKNSLLLKKNALESKIETLKKENTSLHDLVQSLPEDQSHSYESVMTNSLFKKTSLTASIYSGHRKNHVPLTAYVQLQNDNKNLLVKLSQQNCQVNDLSEILRLMFVSNETFIKKKRAAAIDLSTSVGTDSVMESAESAWMSMNQIPVFSSYSYICGSYSNHQDGSLFRINHHVTNTQLATNNPQFSIGIQSSPIPLTPSEEYLKETIRRLRIGWIVIKIDAFDRRDVIAHFDIQEKLLKFHSLRLDKDFQSQLSDTEVFVSSISQIRKTDENGNPSHNHSSLSLICKSEEVLILKFVASEERDFFYDGFLCILCHIDQSFRQTQMINFIAHDDITSSRYLKGNLAKKANGEYTLLSFNRRSLLKQQSSIAVLQSAGVLSNSESKILEFLTPKDNELPILSQSDPIATSLRDSPIEQSSSPPSIIAPHTYSSTSVISGVTTVTDVNPLVEDTPKESKKSTILPNLGIFGSASAPSSQNEDLSDLGSLYSLSEDNRPARKTFFSTKSQNVQTNRMTFSHENPISLNVENSEKVLSKSQSLGPDASNSQKTSNSRSSFSKSSPKNTIASSYSSSSVGAENASRFLRRRSVMNPEGRLSGFKPDVDDIPRESDDSSSVSSHRYSGRSSRRGSASSVLAQQTAQFRQRLSEQTNSLEEEAGNEDSVK